MPGNSQRKGAIRKSSKRPTAGSGGRVRRGLEGRGPTATGFRTRLPRLGLDNIAFAPHYYAPLAIVCEDGGGRTAVINRAFARMEAKAAAPIEKEIGL